MIVKVIPVLDASVDTVTRSLRNFEIVVNEGQEVILVSCTDGSAHPAIVSSISGDYLTSFTLSK